MEELIISKSPAATLNTSTLNTSDHPFFPTDLQVPGYIASPMSAVALLTLFLGGLAAILFSSKALLEWRKPSLSQGKVWKISWFLLCGFIHCFFEGYFSYNYLDMGSRNDFFGQLWKEYALSDSRYMTQDSFVVCMESITAYLWGPLSFLCAYLVITNHPLRHQLQMIVSLGQLYGLILYYATYTFEGLVHGVVLGRPEWIYYYLYYVTCNAFWFFIPMWLIYESTQKASKAFLIAESREKF